jgi:valyl-tRNA synthetase
MSDTSAPEPQDAPSEAYDHIEVEGRIAKAWADARLYAFDPASTKPVYSIDTPPPYVSAAHLHVGHAMSYSQAEFVVRYRRMRGCSIFYPMGFDDNGLPTERFVEKTYGVNKNNTTRKRFRELCTEETQKGAVVYENMWRALGLSVDWTLRYSTIDEHCRRTAQLSFLDLYRQGLLYRAEQPVLWDTVDETSLAQADLETLDRKGKLYDIAFSAPDGSPLVISTTRPELMPGCVGLFHAPGDERYAALKGQHARVPLFDYDVPVLESEDVDPAFGTGLMMVCTFGDGEDVKKWRELKLDTRLVITANGRMSELAGKYAGLKILQARAAIVADLKAAGLVLGEKTVDQHVSVGDRSGEPVEFQMAPQWFIRVLDFKDQLLARSAELEWRPAHMKTRLDQWITGLKYDWNISRQRFYGVPFPLWYVKETGDVILADEADLPVDPTEDSPPAWAQEKYKGMTIVGEADVMDTWMTSSLSPMINMNWAKTPGREGDPSLLPMSLRVQAFEIIRTWLFYTVVKSHFHLKQLPWKAAMISGWGLNEQGKKISKRDLEALTDASGFNRYEPDAVIKKYGADALRYWAAGARLGYDLRYNEKDVKAGRKIVVKLFNVARLCAAYLKDFDPARDAVPLAERPLEDRYIASRLDQVVEQVTESFESYDYAMGREALEKFFWSLYCDNYLEIVKDRMWNSELYDAGSKAAAQTTLWESLRTLLALFAPFMPFITEELYLRAYARGEEQASIHTTEWPAFDATRRDAGAEAQMELVLEVLSAWRFVRSAATLPPRQDILKIDLDVPADVRSRLEGMIPALRAALRCKAIGFAAGTYDAGREGWRMGVVMGERAEAPV